ncbi:MAG: methionyl-tRNA formyltransferase [Candidatus Fischerbacteria bacterium RBG_13_37_8]|uniref:Methionyl-tRNA formyltransferase n=1 Tax=Candidatus Fischerbacteria bacterium RBG_13_37_8 TaxID=1817863 RepID=A0A1F5V5Z9_9BACT|nr:MAG: methionyl-tRNA formyltransferase [Candidatus Fischerbacteria bacterium RBG_13_37_8]
MVMNNIIFFGTSDFAVSTLKELVENKYNVVLVVTQADQPKGRGQKISAPPVKQIADYYSLPSIQPEIIRDQSFYSELKSYSSDIIIVVAYGKILPAEILAIPLHGCINVHASLLPRYRGAAPIQWALLNGEKVTGVTTMYMNEKMDEGNILLQEETGINDNETAPLLSDRLSIIGGSLLIKTLQMLRENALQSIPQNTAEATYAPKIKKENGLIDWNQTAVQIDRMVRAFQPWPSAYCFYNNKLIKIWETEPSPGDSKSEFPPSSIMKIEKDSIFVQCGNNTSLKIKKLQIEGRNIITAKSFLAGHCVSVGESLREG